MVCFNQQQKGKQAEVKACAYLTEKGLSLVQKNYQCYYGEIDLIMRDQHDIVFVEVRSRFRVDYGNALESVNPAKIKKLVKTARHFLQKKKWLDRINSRFDIVVIHPVKGVVQLEWFKNAFTLDY